jgi:hypothetical protein
MSSLYQVSRPCYATRDEVMRAIDIKFTAFDAARIDRAIQSASESIDGRLHRRFFPAIETVYYDWPNFQRAYPWRIWFEDKELADVTTNVPAVTSGGQSIPNANIFWGDPNHSPPFRYMELNINTSSTFGVGNAWQRNVAITGTFGYHVKTDPGGTITANISSTSATSITVSDGIVPGVGDQILIDSEYMMVTDKTLADTTYAGSGCSTASAADNVLVVPDGTKFSVDEVLLLDSERVLIVDINGNDLTVKRAFDGTVLSTHSVPEVYAYRGLTVTRGASGSTAATHTNGASVYRNRVPGLIRSLAIAESVIMVQQEIGASSTQGEGANTPKGTIGTGVADLWDEAITQYGRVARMRAI